MASTSMTSLTGKVIEHGTKMPSGTAASGRGTYLGGARGLVRPTSFDYGSVVADSSDANVVSGNGNSGVRRHARQTLILPEDREFICWDGEGTNGTKGRNQNYS